MGCQKRTYINIISIIISIVLAFIVFSVFSVEVLTGIAALLYFAIGLSIFFLITLIVTSLIRGRREEYCVCEFGPLLLVGILGTVVVSAITIALTVGETVLAVLFGIITFFISLAIINFFLLVLCIVKIGCRCRE